MAQNYGGETAGTSSRTPSHSSNAGDGNEGARFHPYRFPRTSSSQGKLDKRLLIKLYVENVPVSTPEAEFLYEFWKYGEIIEVDRCIDEVTRQPQVECRLYVGPLDPKVNRKDISDTFEPYGHVEEILVNEHGEALVTFANKEMALAAKTTLDGNYVMPGCDIPLKVEFVHPPRPTLNLYVQDRWMDEHMASSSNYQLSQQLRPVTSSAAPEGSGVIGGATHVSTVNPAVIQASSQQQQLAPPQLIPPPKLLPFQGSGQGAVGSNSQFQACHTQIPPFVPVTIQTPPHAFYQALQAVADPQFISEIMNQDPMHNQYITLQIPSNAFQQAVLAATSPQQCPSLSTSTGFQHMNQQRFQQSALPNVSQPSFTPTQPQLLDIGNVAQHTLNQNQVVIPSAAFSTPQVSSSTQSHSPLNLWSEYTTAEGQKYYYNHITHRWQWEKPRDLA